MNSKPAGFRIQIRGQRWKVRFAPIPEKDWLVPGRKEVGRCNYATRTITVDPVSGDPFWTLFHEVTHATLPDNDENSVELMEDAAKRLTSRYPRLKL